jgi:hypothetical protein
MINWLLASKIQWQICHAYSGREQVQQYEKHYTEMRVRHSGQQCLTASGKVLNDE